METEMNERIQQLAEQADNFADDKIKMPGEYHPDWHDVRDEKFAELIVRECVSVCENSNYEFGTIFTKMIKQHFGVAEREE